MAALAVATGTSCSRIDESGLIRLEVHFASVPAPPSVDSLTLHVKFDGYPDDPWDISGWKDLTQARPLKFQPLDFPATGVGVVVMTTVGSQSFSGAPQDKTTLGGTFDVLLEPTPTSNPPGSSRTDAGVPDAGGDADAEADADARDGAADDGPHGADCDATSVDAPPAVTCSEYCEPLVAYCQAEASECQATCAGLQWERTPGVDVGTNTLVCRTHQANLAFDPEQAPSACAGALWSGNHCGAPCDVFCDAGHLDCPGTSLFANPGTCRTQCQMYAQDLPCRIGALVTAGTAADAAAIGAACMKASGAINTCQ